MSGFCIGFKTCTAALKFKALFESEDKILDLQKLTSRVISLCNCKYLLSQICSPTQAGLTWSRASKRWAWGFSFVYDCLLVCRLECSFNFSFKCFFTQEDTVSELPEIPALQHLAKARPKRPKKHAATRGLAKVSLTMEIQWSQCWRHQWSTEYFVKIVDENVAVYEKRIKSLPKNISADGRAGWGGHQGGFGKLLLKIGRQSWTPEDAYCLPGYINSNTGGLVSFSQNHCTLRTVQQCPIVFADNGSCFTSGERFPITIASFRCWGQEPLHHPQAGGLCEEEGGAGQEEGGGDCEEGENGEDIKSIRTLLSSPKHSRRRYWGLHKVQNLSLYQSFCSGW